jgi:hypothetical protein
MGNGAWWKEARPPVHPATIRPPGSVLKALLLFYGRSTVLIENPKN